MSAPDLDQELVDTVADALLRAGGRHTDADYPLLAAAAIAAVGAYEAAPTATEAREAWLVEPFRRLKSAVQMSNLDACLDIVRAAYDAGYCAAGKAKP